MTPEARPRRTQAQRMEQTRSVLVAAAIRALRDDGYRLTTTRRVADYAGVSLGAVAHHFPTRAGLITAALDAVSARLVADVVARTGALRADDPDRTGALLDIMWGSFTGEPFLVWLRVWLAAAEDPELRAAVIEVDRELAGNLTRLLPPLAPDAMDQADWMRRVNVALDAMRGLCLLQHYQPRDGSPTPDRWPATRRELIRLLSQ